MCVVFVACWKPLLFPMHFFGLSFGYHHAQLTICQKFVLSV